MVDDGIDLRHPGLAGADVIERFYGNATKENSTTYDPDRLPFSHGTAVASTLLSNAQVPDNRHNFHGLTPAAQLHVFTIPTSDAGDPLYLRPLVQIMTDAHSAGLRILNVSLSHGRHITAEDTPATADHSPTLTAAFTQADVADKDHHRHRHRQRIPPATQGVRRGPPV